MVNTTKRRISTQSIQISTSDIVIKKIYECIKSDVKKIRNNETEGG